MQFHVSALLAGLLGLSLYSAPVQAQRTVRSINTDWQFHHGELHSLADTAGWERVSLPHTWNVADVTDDMPGYYRGPGWYKKILYVPASWKGRHVQLRFEGVGQTAAVYVNGKPAGSHVGGYTAFVVPLDDLLLQGDSLTANEILVRADNSYNDDIPPLSADFTFYGGIYRDVFLETAGATHFALNDYAGPGIYIHIPQVSATEAQVAVSGSIAGAGAGLRVRMQVTDADGNIVAQQETKLKKGDTSFRIAIPVIKTPHLWSPEDPYLYQVTASLLPEKGREVLDAVSQPLGLRWFSFDAEKGFFLNGKAVKLVGASRHQDYPGLGNALPDAQGVRDMELLKAMGANFVRIAHYPQDPAVLAACDRLGLLASVETPEVNRVTESAAFAQNSQHMQVEMIRQNFNHPSIIIWGYMNEVMLVPRYDNGSAARKAYNATVYAQARALDSITRKEDPSRYTLLPCHGDFDRYHSIGLTKIPQLLGWNLYQGWYGGDFSGLDAFLDRHHKDLPGVPLLLTEYGADADERLRSFAPVRFDKTVDYAVAYHKHYLKAVMDRPFVAAAMIWTLVDFNSEGRTESTPHINSKGLADTERKPKDVYYYYQSHLLQTPFVKIASRGWDVRAGVALGDTALYCKQPVEIYSNQPEVTVLLNGRMLQTVAPVNGVAKVEVPFVNGLNELEASSGAACRDVVNIQFHLVPADLRSVVLPFTSLHVNLGDARYFTANGVAWLPEQPYHPGSWGYVGGKVYKMERSQVPYGSGKDILGTDLDPLYQTQRVGLDTFRLDVPDGMYAVTLHFCELLSDRERQQLVYNLNGGAEETAGKAHRRAFDVLVNGSVVLEGIGNGNELVPERAFSTKVMVAVHGGQGIVVTFRALAGEDVLNALEVEKI
ncbi:beta-galactosidase [Chitinophaga parva]|uniref:Beta-galactosidase n=1 Tax=Chitinophaga parva TaxID=2169414 RepID=A0A2T7BBM3_9BACT|nr:glycoside hydrolase family 2 TIM barrel-domain containing protein [Chitinophaga parva]PUZ21773.1 beta-galactosidase [Chitinophaga parva]